VHEALRPWVPSTDDPWDVDAAAHLWRRAGFGAPPRTVRETLALDPAAAAAAVVRGPDATPAIDELDSVLESVLGVANADQARAWLLARMIRSEHPLRERMALFWHGHFATSIAKVKLLDWMMRQYGLFLDHGLGRFGALLHEVTRDPAMIRWLDNETNRKGHPNENYARELLELFTLGVGNYTERDVREAARAFTGWHILRDRFHFSPLLHDDGEKTVLGRTGRLGGEDVQEIALAQEACGRFLAGKLLAFFVLPHPPADLVAALGDVMRRNGYDVAATLELVFASRVFYAPDSRRSLVRSPVDFVVGASRSLGFSGDASGLVPLLREMGQDLLAPPNVKGWPGQRDWINTATWLARVAAARRLAEARAPGEAGETAVDQYGEALLGRPVPQPERERLSAGGTNPVDVLHAVLSLPEAHLS